MSNFASQIAAFGNKCGIRMDQVVRKVVLDLGRELVTRTPVDTGMARSNWFFGFDRISSVDSTRSKNGAPSLARAAAFTSGLKAGTVCYITNNLPYIMRLEFGYSKQAPAGMARITVARFQRMVDGIAAGVR